MMCLLDGEGIELNLNLKQAFIVDFFHHNSKKNKYR